MHIRPQKIQQNQNEAESQNQKYNLGFLISCLCCEPKFQHIYEVMSQLDVEELKVLHKELKQGNGNKKLNQFLELEFKNRIGK